MGVILVGLWGVSYRSQRCKGFSSSANRDPMPDRHSPQGRLSRQLGGWSAEWDQMPQRVRNVMLEGVHVLGSGEALNFYPFMRGFT